MAAGLETVWTFLYRVKKARSCCRAFSFGLSAGTAIAGLYAIGAAMHPEQQQDRGANGQLRFLSAKAMSPPCSSCAILTQNISRESTMTRKVKAAALSWIAEMPVQTFIGSSFLRGELVRAAVGRLSIWLAGLDLGCWLGARLRLMQDDAVEQAELADPRLAP